MVTWKNSTVINRPPEIVFAVVLDPDQAGKWHAGSTAMRKITDGPPTIGTRYQIEMRVPGNERDAVTAITKYEPPTNVTFETLSGPIQFSTRYLLEPIDGGTRLTETVDMAMAGLMRLMSPLIRLASSQNSRGGLRRLKQLIEDGEGE